MTTLCQESELIEVSKLLEKAHQKIGRLECEKNSNQNRASLYGGWCRDISGKNSTKHATDLNLAKQLSEFLQLKSVASFGDGPGEYKKHILSLNQVEKYDAFDGAPYTEETTDNLVEFLDLSVPIYHLPKYDWVISMEVAEHIPKEFESIFINNLARHAKEGIILSWAAVGQSGFSHVNEQDLTYVINKFEKINFIIDYANSKVLQNAATLWWLKKNLYVFRQKNYKL